MDRHATAGRRDAGHAQCAGRHSSRGISNRYAHRLVNRYGLAADGIARNVANLGEIFDDTFSEAEIATCAITVVRSADSMLQRRTKTNLLASPASLVRIRELVTQAL